MKAKEQQNSAPAVRRGRRVVGWVVPLALAASLAALALAAPAPAPVHEGAFGAHPGAPVPGSEGAAPRAGGRHVTLRGCWLTVAFLPPPLDALRDALRAPLDLSMTFYGPDPLVGTWGLSCDRARVSGRRVERLILALVAAPVGLTGQHAQPLANNFAHQLVRADTDRRALARVLRRRGMPARVARDARFRHSRPEALPATGEVVVPGVYRTAVAASDLDPTNPHDHVNGFTWLGRNGRIAILDLLLDDAHDRFCFPPSPTCSAVVRAHRRSPLRDLLGDGSSPVRVAFDHARISRVDLRLTRIPTT